MNTTIKAYIVDHPQGSEGWHKHRLNSLNASELAAAMGLSSYISRAELIKQKATGIVPEIDPATKRRFDKGHEIEAISRPWAEEIVEDDLYANTFAAEVDGLLLSASLDGRDMMNSITWECKSLNDDLAASLNAGVIPDKYHPQMEQGLMLTGATKCMFSASNGTKESMRSVWYESNPELRAKIIPTWKQFMADVAAYVPTEAAPKVVAEATESLPAVSVRMDGAIAVISNLDLFGDQLKKFVAQIDKEPATDQAFANCESAVKTLKKAEDALDAAEAQALAQIDPVESMRRTVADYKELARTTRLMLEKVVKARKETIKAEIVAGGIAGLAKHLRELNAAMPDDYMPQVPADFGGCIKGLKSVDSIRNAVDTELSRAKIAASEIANKIHANVKAIKDADAPHLFAYDIKALLLKAPEDLAAVIAQRIAAEKAKEEAQRERIRAEEAARLEREAAAKAAAEKAEAERLERQREQDEANAKANSEAAAIWNSSRPTEPLKISDFKDPMPVAGDAPTSISPLNQTIGKMATEAFNRRPMADQDWPNASAEDNGNRLTLGQINELLAPVSITVAGLASLGFEPVEQVKASRLYRDCDFPAICAAISAHVMSAIVATHETV